MKIAVIGAGISGLAAAHWLSKYHEVHVYEANDYLGGHTHTVDVNVDDEVHAIDTGFIVFNDWTYPNFIQLLDELKVRSHPTEMSFSVRNDLSGLEYCGSTLNGLFAQRKNALSGRFWRMLIDIVRFNRLGKKITSSELHIDEDEMTIADFLKKHKLSLNFSENYLLPMGAAIWSCPVGIFERFPIRFIIEFYNNHGLLNLVRRPTWRFVEGGARTYVEAITKRFPGTIYRSTPISKVERFPDRAELKPCGRETATYDHVIFGCHSDQALSILSDPTPVELELLSAFPYEKNLAILHTDESVLPRNRRAWASWNYWIHGNSQPASTVTYNMNILQKVKSKKTLCVSLNCEDHIDPRAIMGRYHYEHPIFTTARSRAQSRHQDLMNKNRSSYVGAYWRNGFHEDGVVSAMAVCKALNTTKRQPQEPYLIN